MTDPIAPDRLPDMFSPVTLLILVVMVLFTAADDAPNHVVLFRQVTMMGETMNVPYSCIPEIKKNVTTLFIAEKSKLPFVLNTAISILKHSGGFGAFAILCVDCRRDQAVEWSKKGIHVIGSNFLQDMAMYAFRKNGPMPYTATSPEGDMRRHSVHMLYREWVKATLLENGLSVLLADIDISFNSSVPFFTAKEDVVLEGDWPNDFRRNWYSFKYGKKGDWTILNNGVALFTATPAMLAFSRQFMGLMVHSVVADFGFAQTSFAKHLHDLQLQLKPKSGHLVGKLCLMCRLSLVGGSKLHFFFLFIFCRFYPHRSVGKSLMEHTK